MNKKHRKTLDAIKTKPTIANIRFADIEKLLIALGAEKIEGRGSRVGFVMPDGFKWEAHRPHPQKEARKYQVDSLRDFLELLNYE
ncbi:MAG: type II toxin-antitoxin system HicA family toxin [Pyrinomonadaceae bacterium]